MSWISIIIQLVLALPKIIALVQEIIAIINQHKSPAVQTVYFSHLRGILQRVRTKGLTAQALVELHKFRDDVKSTVWVDASFLFFYLVR